MAKYNRFTDANKRPGYRKRFDKLWELLIPPDSRDIADKGISQIVGKGIMLPSTRQSVSDRIKLDQLKILVQNKRSWFNNPTNEDEKAKAKEIKELLSEIWWKDPESPTALWLEKSKSGLGIIEETNLNITLGLNSLSDTDRKALEKRLGIEKGYIKFSQIKAYAEGIESRERELDRAVRAESGKDYRESLRSYKDALRTFESKQREYERQLRRYNRGEIKTPPTEPLKPDKPPIEDFQQLPPNVIKTLRKIESRMNRWNRRQAGRTTWAETFRDLGNRKNKIRGRDSALDYAKVTRVATNVVTGKTEEIEETLAEAALDANGKLKSEILFPQTNDAYSKETSQKIRTELEQNQRRARAIGDTIGALGDTVNDLKFFTADFHDQDRGLFYAKASHKAFALGEIGSIQFKNTEGKIERIGEGLIKEIDNKVGYRTVINQHTIFDLLGVNEANHDFCFETKRPGSSEKEIKGFRATLALHLASIAQSARKNGGPEALQRLNEVDLKKIIEASSEDFHSLNDSEKLAYQEVFKVIGNQIRRYIGAEYGLIRDSFEDTFSGEKSYFGEAPIQKRAKRNIPEELLRVEALLRQIEENPGSEALGDINWDSPTIQKIIKHLDIVGTNIFGLDTKFNSLKDKVKFIPGGKEGYRILVIDENGNETYYDPYKDLDLELKTANVMAARALGNQIEQFARDPIMTPVVGWYKWVTNQALTRTKVNGAYNWAKDKYYNFTDFGQKNVNAPKLSNIQFSKLLKNLILKVGDGALWKIDPETGQVASNLYYMATEGYNVFLDWFIGIDEKNPGWLEKTLGTFSMKRNISVWEWVPKSLDKDGNIIKGHVKKGLWKPSFFGSSKRKKRLKENQSILDVLLNVVISIASNTVFLALNKIPFVGKYIVAPLTNIYNITTDFIKSIPENLYKKIVPLENPGAGFSKLWNQTTLRTVWNWTKAGWQLPRHIVKAGFSSLLPAVIAGFTFNNPVAFTIIGGMSFGPALLKELAAWSGRNAIIQTQFKTFKTLEVLFGKNFNHLTAAEHFLCSPGKIEIPRLFGLEKLIYTGNSEVGFTMRGNRLAKFLGNHANIRGIVNGMGLASYTISIAYLMTGNVFVAGLTGVGTIVANIAYENVASFIAHKASKYAALITGTKELLGGVLMGSVSYAVGVNFVRNMFRAAYQTYIEGDPNAWNDWKNQYFGSLGATTSSVSTMVLGVQGLFTIVGGVKGWAESMFAIATAKSSFGGSFIAQFGNIQLTGVALAGGIIGAIIGAGLGLLFGAQLGGILGGTIGGAIGAVLGGTGLLATILTGSIVIVFSATGLIIGAVVLGTIGSLIGIGIEKIIGPTIQNLANSFQNIYQGITTFISVLSVIRLLSSRNIADVAAAAITLAVSGLLSFQAIQSQQLAAASYMVTDDAGGDYNTSEITESLPSQIKNLKKEFVGFENDGKTVRYKIIVENTDETGNTITVQIEDILKSDSNTGITSNPISSPSTEGLIADLGQETIAPGEEKIYEITFTNETQNFSGNGGFIENNTNEMLCNKVKVKGYVEGDSENDFEGGNTICINKDGEKVYAGEMVAESAKKIADGLQPAWWGFYNYHPDYPQNFNMEKYRSALNPDGGKANNTIPCTSNCPNGWTAGGDGMFWCNCLPHYAYKEVGITLPNGDVTSQRLYVRQNGEYNGVYLETDIGSNNCLSSSDLTKLKGSKLNVRDIEIGDVAFFAKDKRLNDGSGCYDLDAHVAIVAEVTSSYVKTYESNNWNTEIKYTVLPDGSIDKEGDLIFNGVGRLQ